jgi:hypothetical protein
MGRKGGLGSNPLTKEEMSLQKKGIANLSVTELRQWIRACEKMEEWVDSAKGRRSWREERLEAEERLQVLAGTDEVE